ncbi:D-lyxose/D-mannose family sugar isomerase [Marinoscillum furvescens]|uniref:D-lyxose ketol-isomerase n=1 Tax=Marinoscillum furvescens DSM 4134 TaxID=1122208 RepID=A0A3D9KZT3_MARFU|nr:D-lyxose/D-mannose family sugar isomerase [Marinoscillum furvescens]RED95666.1 D-lyxose ketol-isomerase [Marinoscillum furvescens DSM 4134]
MITKKEFNEACAEALQMIADAGIVLTLEDREKITAADFGLSNLRKEGIQILTMFETDRIAGKILVLFPNQTEPEHWHPPVGNDPGKEEIIRAISGDLYFYIPGEDTLDKGFIVDGKSDCYTMRHEVDLKPGDQLVLPSGTKHWFQAGPAGAVMYSFSTKVRDTLDQFTDPNIIRETKIVA